MIASLLGTGVALERLGSIELDFVVSLRKRGVDSFFADGAVLADRDGLAALELVPAEALEKKPRMLCCLPVEGACPSFLAVDGVLAGVRAGVDFSPMMRGAESQNALKFLAEFLTQWFKRYREQLTYGFVAS